MFCTKVLISYSGARICAGASGRAPDHHPPRHQLLVTWSFDDSGSGVDASTCLLEVREDEGAWQTFSTDWWGGDATHDGQPGHTYTFRLSASDNVSNTASTEVEAVFPYVKKYYYDNGQRIAMQKEGVVYYLHTDHPSTGSGQAWAPPA